MAKKVPNIPTYYESKGTPIYRDTTDAPPMNYEDGGYMELTDDEIAQYRKGGCLIMEDGGPLKEKPKEEAKKEEHPMNRQAAMPDWFKYGELPARAHEKKFSPYAFQTKLNPEQTQLPFDLNVAGVGAKYNIPIGDKFTISPKASLANVTGVQGGKPIFNKTTLGDVGVGVKFKFEDGGPLGTVPTEPVTPAAPVIPPVSQSTDPFITPEQYVAYDPTGLGAYQQELIKKSSDEQGRPLWETDPRMQENIRGLWKTANIGYDPQNPKKRWTSIETSPETLPWSAVTTSNFVRHTVGPEEIKKFRADAGHSTYIKEALKTAKDPSNKFNLYTATPLKNREFDVGEILFRGRAAQKGWTYEDFTKAKGDYASHSDIITGKGEDEKGPYYEMTGGNVGDTTGAKKRAGDTRKDETGGVLKTFKVYYDPKTGTPKSGGYRGGMVLDPKVKEQRSKVRKVRTLPMAPVPQTVEGNIGKTPEMLVQESMQGIPLQGFANGGSLNDYEEAELTEQEIQDLRSKGYIIEDL